MAAVSAWGEKDSGSLTPTKNYLETAIAKKLRGVYRPDALGRLARRQAGLNRCEIEGRFHAEIRFEWAFRSTRQARLKLASLLAHRSGKENHRFTCPTRELLSIYPGFVSLYDTTELKFDETWRDTCLLLGAPLAKGPRLDEIKQLLEPLEEQLGGKVILEDGGFYLKTPSGSIEAHLVAEGLRKLAMIARLIATGSLIGTGSLFWDEPEANLNPKVIKLVAKTILHLCQQGIQVYVASHSLFSPSRTRHPLEIRCVQRRGGKVLSGLHRSGDGVDVEQGPTVDDIGQIDALQEELSQSDRYLETEAE